MTTEAERELCEICANRWIHIYVNGEFKQDIPCPGACGKCPGFVPGNIPKEGQQ